MKPSGAEPSTGQRDSVPRSSWYSGVTRYEWLVLAIASVGWIFDAFEGQIFNVTRNQLLADLLGQGATEANIRMYGEVFLSVFLLGGTLGGLLFGSLADRWGRRPTLVITILMYSGFSGLTCFATSVWQVGALRFLVAMGVGGEWAVAAALVAEVFPTHARAQASSIFHSSSIIGTWLAAVTGLAVGANWRYAFLLGVLPALLTLFVRMKVQEPESWLAAKQQSRSSVHVRLGSFRELLLNPLWSKRAILGMLLAAVGLGTFWGVTVAGQDLARDLLLRTGAAPAEAAEKSKVAYGFVQAAGGGVGMLAFGPISVLLGRKRTFLLYLVGGLVIVPVTCYVPSSYAQLLALLPFYGALTLGYHAGFAVYFPELFPDHLRSTGAGFCFNGGRLLAASVLIFSGWLKSLPDMDLPKAITLLALLFIPGMIVLLFLPETKGQALRSAA